MLTHAFWAGCSDTQWTPSYNRPNQSAETRGPRSVMKHLTADLVQLLVTLDWPVALWLSSTTGGWPNSMYQLGRILWIIPVLMWHGPGELHGGSALWERNDTEGATVAWRCSVDRQRGGCEVAMSIANAISHVASCGSGVPSDFYLLEISTWVTDRNYRISDKLYLIVETGVWGKNTMVSKGKKNSVNNALQVLKGKPTFCMFCLKRHVFL